MSIVLPTKKVKADRVNPKRLIVYSKPKTGKTTAFAGLDDNLIIDLENGADYVEAIKVKANNLQELKEIGKAIKEGGNPYKYIAVDTITALEEMVVPYAELLYSKSPMGKNWFNPGGGKEKYGNILGLPEGAGYFWTRQAFTKVIDYIKTWAPYVIFVGHVKDTQLEKAGSTFNSLDLDLTGKLERITSSNADAIGYLYRKGKKNILSFLTNDEVACGARPEHRSNQEIIISEIGENGEYVTHWDKVFID